MQTLSVELGRRSYPIYIGDGVLKNSSLLQKHVKDRQVMIVSHPSLTNLYLNTVKSAFKNYRCDEVILPEGEEHKNFSTLMKIFDALIEHQHTRQTTLIALGGGVVGDMTGFAAACYQRGVNFVQIPTSLLAQVDASVGGKTAINHPKAKNMIGAFHQPSAVIIDIQTLDTLPDREFRAGLAEIIKAALIRDADFFSWLERNMNELLLRDSKALMYAIEQACAIKISIVVQDETEMHERALLNFGHTFGHAIEQNLGYGTWLHGEAVAVGIVLAARLSHRLGWLTQSEEQRISNLLTAAQLPINLPKELECQRMLDTMLLDKKVLGENLRFIVLKAIGQAIVTQDVPTDLVKEIINENFQRVS